MLKIVSLLLLLSTGLVQAAALDEQSVRRFVKQIDDHVQAREFDALRPLFSRDAAFVIKINDVDEANTVVLSYDDYFNNIETALRGIDRYVFHRSIEKVVIGNGGQSARVLSKLEETYTSNGVSETDLSQGVMEVGYQDGRLIVKGAVITTQQKDAYSMTRCQDNKTCPDFRALFPNIASIQTEWLDSRYQGLIVDNSRGHKSLKRDYALLEDLVGEATCYALIMPPYDETGTKTYYRINDKRTLHKLLQGNASDFMVLQYVDPAEHKHLSDFTLFRNSIWKEDQVNNLTLVIPDRHLIVDWSWSDEIHIIANDIATMSRVREYLGKKAYANTEKPVAPSFDSYKFYMTRAQLDMLKPRLEKYEVAEESISTTLADMSKQGDDYYHVFVYDKSTDKRWKTMAIEADIRLISVEEFSQLLDRLIREMENM